MSVFDAADRARAPTMMRRTHADLSSQGRPEGNHSAEPRARASGRLCPICGYPIGSERCPECGTVLLADADPELLRHLSSRERTRVLVAARLVAVSGGFLLAGFCFGLLDSYLPLALPSWAASPADTALDVLMWSTPLGLALLLAGSWMGAATPLGHTPRQSFCARAAVLGLCFGLSASISLLILADFSIVLISFEQMLLALCALFGVFVWSQIGVWTRLWRRTRTVRYPGGLRARPVRVVPLMFHAATIASIVMGLTGIVLDDWASVFFSFSTSSLLCVIGCGIAAMCSVAKAVADELRAAQ